MPLRFIHLRNLLTRARSLLYRSRMRYSNPWNGKSQFYKGRRKLPSAKTDKEYQDYLKGKKDKSKAMDYKTWCKDQRRKFGLF